MENNIENFNWNIFQAVLLGLIIFFLIVIYAKNKKYSEKTFLLGILLMLIGIVLNILDLVIISDGFFVFSYVVIGLSLIRYFFIETSK